MDNMYYLCYEKTVLQRTPIQEVLLPNMFAVSLSQDLTIVIWNAVEAGNDPLAAFSFSHSMEERGREGEKARILAMKEHENELECSYRSKEAH